MAVEFEKLKFTRDWNNSSDFPTYEENEQKVRADMQALHDETKEFINEKLIPGIENMAVPGTGDMKAEVYDPENKRENVYRYTDDAVKGVTIGSIGAASHSAMMSHVENTGNPHQVKASQISVTADTVAAYKQEGDWSVDGILTFVGDLLNSVGATYQWRRDREELIADYPSTYSFLDQKGAFTPTTVYYSDEVTLDDDGRIMLVNPSSVDLKTLSGTDRVFPVGKYFYALNYKGLPCVYRVTADTTCESKVDTNANYTTRYYYYNTEKWEIGTVTEVVRSTDPNAHYDGEVDADGWAYTAIAPILANVARVQSSSYVGTGTYGANNLCTLSFDFVPKLVWIRNQANGNMALFFASTLTDAFSASGYVYATNTGNLASAAGYYAAIDGRNLNWYGSNATTQMNVSGDTYSIGAIG